MEIEHVRAAEAILGDALVSVQNYYNVMFHHGANKYREDSEKVLNECELREWAFVAWEPLGTGAGLPGIDDQETFRRRALNRIDAVCEKHNVTPHVARLAAVLSRSKQIIAIPGTSSVAHLEANMAAIKLSENENFDAAWWIQRPVLMSLREQSRLEDLQRRVEAAPTPGLSAAELPPWRPARPEREDRD